MVQLLGASGMARRGEGAGGQVDGVSGQSCQWYGGTDGWGDLPLTTLLQRWTAGGGVKTIFVVALGASIKAMLDVSLAKSE